MIEQLYFVVQWPSKSSVLLLPVDRAWTMLLFFPPLLQGWNLVQLGSRRLQLSRAAVERHSERQLRSDRDKRSELRN